MNATAETARATKRPFIREQSLAEAKQACGGGTSTRNGFVPYKRHPQLGILMPIRVIPHAHGERGGYPFPEIKNGVAEWALPGGGIYYSIDPVIFA